MEFCYLDFVTQYCRVSFLFGCWRQDSLANRLGRHLCRLFVPPCRCSTRPSFRWPFQWSSPPWRPDCPWFRQRAPQSLNAQSCGSAFLWPCWRARWGCWTHWSWIWETRLRLSSRWWRVWSRCARSSRPRLRGCRSRESCIWLARPPRAECATAFHSSHWRDSWPKSWRILCW